MTITDVARERRHHELVAEVCTEIGEDRTAQAAYTEAEVCKAEIRARLAALVTK